MKKRILCLLLFIMIISVTVLSATSCTYVVKSENLMEGITPNPVNRVENLKTDSYILTNFGIEVFKASFEKDENTLVSPLSVISALSMTANGAKGETLSQMEKVFGMPIEDLNKYLYTYVNSLPQGEKYKLNLANSIWFTHDPRFTVNQDFLQANADYYGADVYKSAFDDSTLKDINNWVKEKTDDMIPKILDEIPEEAVMYLVNALAFEAEWKDIYEKNQVRDGEFTLENGTKQTVEFMYSQEGKYLENENSKGFIKYYNGNKYAFVALLPNEGISVTDYIQTLNGESLNQLLSNPQNATVNAAIPKFETEYEIEMKTVFQSLGMTDAFDGNKADFSDLGTSTDGNIYISRILHKTFISVGEKGTKAGAATVVEMVDESAEVIIDPKTVCLDRPFVYMLVDCQTNIPFFIGTMMNVNG